MTNCDMTTPERSVDEISWQKQFLDDAIELMAEDLSIMIPTVGKLLQAERQRCEEMVSRITVFAEHRPTCFLYSCEDEEYQLSKCDCGLYKALTQPNNK